MGSRQILKVVGLCLIAAIYFFTSDEFAGNNKSNSKSIASPPSSTSQSVPNWSDSTPAINLRHIFYGEINRRGKPTGFHARPGGKDPSSSRIKKIKSKANKEGIYTADVEVYDSSQKSWKAKFSSFFPNSFSKDDVINAILNAYKKRNKAKNEPWSGPSGHGFLIQGYLNRDGKINTAFPVYRRN